VASLLLSRATLVWVILVAATGLSWEMGHGLGTASVRLADVGILVIAFLKVRLVILEFMELRGAPTFMRLAGEIWVVTICTTLIALFLKAPLPELGGSQAGSAPAARLASPAITHD